MPAPIPLIVFAVPEETKAFQKRIAPTDRLNGDKGVRCRRGSIGWERTWPTLRVLTTGMGTGNSKTAFEDVYSSARPSFVLTCGFAGGLNPDLPLGTVLFDTDAVFPLLGGLTSGGARRGTFHCADHVAVTVAQKAALRGSTGADSNERGRRSTRGMVRREWPRRAAVPRSPATISRARPGNPSR